VKILPTQVIEHDENDVRPVFRMDLQRERKDSGNEKNSEFHK
jgi:hypothetical protein